MQAVLYVCHGSRMKAAVNEAVDFTKECMKTVAAPLQLCCFLEFSNPSVQKGIEECVRRGAKEIAIVPVLLLTAVHAKKDIPDVLNRAKKIYPNVEFTYGRPLGIQKRLVDVLVEHIEKERETPNDMHLLLVGRGSSDEEAVEDTKTIARLLEQRVNVHVHVCFLAAAHPHFEKKLQAIISGGAHHIVILPYLLFTGLLMKDIKDTVHEFQSKKQKVTVCDYLGGHRNVPHALRDRVLELI